MSIGFLGSKKEWITTALTSKSTSSSFNTTFDTTKSTTTAFNTSKSTTTTFNTSYTTSYTGTGSYTPFYGTAYRYMWMLHNNSSGMLFWNGSNLTGGFTYGANSSVSTYTIGSYQYNRGSLFYYESAAYKGYKIRRRQTNVQLSHTTSRSTSKSTTTTFATSLATTTTFSTSRSTTTTFTTSFNTDRMTSFYL